MWTQASKKHIPNCAKQKQKIKEQKYRNNNVYSSLLETHSKVHKTKIKEQKYRNDNVDLSL